MLDRMIALAAKAHEGQFDKGGKPYILHPLEVMRLTGSTDEVVQCIAVGHDLLEDTSVTFDLLLKEFEYDVAEGISDLTKWPGESYKVYKEHIMANPLARIVKMADLQHNSDLTRLKGVAQKDFDRVARYMEFYKELQNAN